MSHSSGRSLIVGNWKMYKTIAETRAYIHQLLPLLDKRSAHAWLAVPFTAISEAVRAAEGSPVLIGAQNVGIADEGAFTGEISCRMLKEAGASFVIVGHSERRQFYGEDDSIVNQKTLRVLKEGITPIVCIGETAEQRKLGHAKDVLRVQLSKSFANIPAEAFAKLKIAYEPIWAIGTNLTATPELAQEMHLFCRQEIERQWGKTAAGAVEILYGGSVKPESAAALLVEPDINGLLVGGSSLTVESFSQIVNNDQHINAS